VHQPGLIEIFGTDEQPATPRRLAAGALTVDIADGAVRAVCWHGVEVFRGVDYPLRDANWGTFPTETLSEDFAEHGDRFAYNRQFRSGGDRFTGSFSCLGTVEGALTLELRLTANEHTEVNRAGFVVLHPVAGVAGSPLLVTHSDGRTEETSFPQAIAPSQPVFDIVALRQSACGVTADIAFAGDVFEMEDQRNWSDASYKTYCRPLALPAPYALAAGAVIEQRIAISLSGRGAATAAARADGIALAPPTGRRFPELALALEAGWVSDSRALRLLSTPTLLRIDLTDPAWQGQLPALLKAVSAELDLELVVADTEAEAASSLNALRDLLEKQDIVPRSVIALPRAYLKSYQPDAVWPAGVTPERAAALARLAFPALVIGGGMLTNFTELNRYREAAAAGDFLTHGLTAIVHAADDKSVLQTLEAMPQIFESAEALAPGKSYRLGLVAIGMRSNPYGAALADNPARVRRPMAGQDPRQNGLFGAAWMVGAVAATEASAVERLALAAPAGPFGLVEGERLRPLYHAFLGLSRLQGRERLAVATPAGLAAVAVDTPEGTAVIVANMKPEAQEVALPEAARFVILEAAQQDPRWLQTAPRVQGRALTLAPHAVAFASIGPQDCFGGGR
jgi:hypothetical protein